MKKFIALLFLCTAVLMSGCHRYFSLVSDDYISGESYPEAELYRVGDFTCAAGDVSSVEIYWRSGEVRIAESDGAELHVRESGDNLPDDAAMHCLLENGALKIRFCGSGAKISVKPDDKHLIVEIPKGINLAVHTTAADVKADRLEQKSVSVSAHSGKTELGTITAETVDLSSSSGSIAANIISAGMLRCGASSGSVDFGAVSAGNLDCDTSSGSVRIGDVTAERINIGTRSGNVSLVLIKAPLADISSVSGKITLTAPKDGADISYTSGSGKLHTDLAYERKGDLYVFGSGKSKLTVETSSGNLEIQ